MTRFPSTAHFEITASRRLGLDRCEFDVKITKGSILEGELFQITERGTVWEWVVLAIDRSKAGTKITCMNWVPENGAFVGERTFTRAMEAVERKRYAKHLENA